MRDLGESNLTENTMNFEGVCKLPCIFLHGKGSITAKGPKDNIAIIINEFNQVSEYRKMAGLKIEYADSNGIDCVVEASVSYLESGFIDFQKLANDVIRVDFDGVMKVDVSGKAVRDIFEDECTWGITGALGNYCQISDVLEIDTENIYISKNRPKLKGV